MEGQVTLMMPCSPTALAGKTRTCRWRSLFSGSKLWITSFRRSCAIANGAERHTASEATLAVAHDTAVHGKKVGRFQSCNSAQDLSA